MSSSRAAATTKQAAAAGTSSSLAGSRSSAIAASTSSSAAAASSSAVASSSSAAAASSSSSSAAAVSSSSSSLAASSSSSLAASSARASSTAIVSAESAAASTTKKGLSGGAIGGIVGGVVGGLALVLLIWFLLKWRKERAERVPPPPPREVTYNPVTLPRSREQSGTMPMRGNSMSGLIATGRPSSTFPSQSRPQSYYNTYPVATPSSGSHDNSPPMPPTTTADSPPFAAQPPSGSQTPNKKPSLTPLNTGLRRDDSSSSGEAPIQMTTQPRHKSSVDRLRNAAAGPSRAPSPASVSELGDTATNSLRSSSPHPSTHAFSNPHRPNIPSSLSPAPSHGYPRPYSTHSLTSSARQFAPPQGNAPHQKSMQLEMPKLLGARPDSNGDFFWGQARPPQDGFSLGLNGHRRQTSRDFMPDNIGNHTRYSSMQSTSARTNPDAHEPPPADPRMVLNRM